MSSIDLVTNLELKIVVDQNSSLVLVASTDRTATAQMQWTLRCCVRGVERLGEDVAFLNLHIIGQVYLLVTDRL